MAFLAYFLFAIVIFVYNYKCYKKSVVVFTMKKKYISTYEKKYYHIQFYFWNCIVIFFVLIGTLNYFNKNKSLFLIYLISAIIFFWGINFFLEDMALKRNYIKIKR